MELRERIAAAAFQGFEGNGHDWEWLNSRPEVAEGWPQSEIDDWLRVADKIIESLGLHEQWSYRGNKPPWFKERRYATAWEHV